MKRVRRPLAPLPNSQGPVRLWPRTRPINRHIVERSLRIAAFGPHTCRPFPVRPVHELWCIAATGAEHCMCGGDA